MSLKENLMKLSLNHFFAQRNYLLSNVFMNNFQYLRIIDFRDKDSVY